MQMTLQPLQPANFSYPMIQMKGMQDIGLHIFCLRNFLILIWLNRPTHILLEKFSHFDLVKSPAHMYK